MDYGKQTKQVLFEIKTPSGSLVSSHILNLQHWTIRWRPEWYSGKATDKALSGNKRSNWDGFDAKITIRWEHSMQDSQIKDLINAMKSAIDARNEIFFSIVGVADKKLKVVPSDGIEFAYEYQSTIGKAPMAVVLELAKIKNQIGYD